jgi:hypothetical protein
MDFAHATSRNTIAIGVCQDDQFRSPSLLVKILVKMLLAGTPSPEHHPYTIDIETREYEIIIPTSLINQL